MEKKMLKSIYEAIVNYYYIVLIPVLSISVLFVSQYMTRGIEYFLNTQGKIRWGFLSFIAVLQFFVSILITWSVLSAFNSNFLSEYDTLKMACMIIIGSSPFNITILVWVALKLEAYRLMKQRYGDDFHHGSILEDIEAMQKDKASPKVEQKQEKVIKNETIIQENIIKDEKNNGKSNE